MFLCSGVFLLLVKCYTTCCIVVHVHNCACVCVFVCADFFRVCVSVDVGRYSTDLLFARAAAASAFLCGEGGRKVEAVPSRKHY